MYDLDAGYVRRSPVLRGVCGSLRSGNIYGLLGANGSGKTTLLKTLAGGLHPLRGSVDVVGCTPSQRSRDFLSAVVYMPDEVVLPALSLSGFESTYSRFHSRFSHDDFAEYLRLLDFGEGVRLDRLSTGNRKKLFIAYAMACNPSLLLMDEPTNGLDIESMRSFRRLLVRFGAGDRTVVISTHQAADLESALSAVVIVRDGEVALNACFDDISSCLSFGGAAGGDVLYADGLRAVSRNASGEYTDVDVELLYLALHASADVRDIVARNLSGKEGVC